MAQCAQDDPRSEARLPARGDLGTGVERVRGAADSGVHGTHDVRELEPPVDMELGRETNLDVSHPLGLAVLTQLERCPLERFAILEYGHGVPKPLEIFQEVGVAGPKDPFPKSLLCRRRQLDAVLAGQLDECAQA
jgi:hypothetical protein